MKESLFLRIGGHDLMLKRKEVTHAYENLEMLENIFEMAQRFEEHGLGETDVFSF